MKTSTKPTSRCCAKGPDLSRRKFLIAGAGASAFAMMGCSSLFGDKNYSEAYANVIKSHNSLRSYWRFDNNITDLVSGKPAASNGEISFVDGALKGSGIKLAPESMLAVKDTENLYGRFATIELFFKVDSAPEGDENPVIIAQADGEEVRYIIGVKNDLSALLYRNRLEKVVTRIDIPTGQKIEVGRWYHLAVTSFDLDLRAYLDGYECSLFGGAYEFTRKGPKTSVMTFGSTTASGWGAGNVSLDEVATFEEGLTQKDFHQHLNAAGWQQKLAETGALVAKVQANQNSVRAKKTETILKDPMLTEPGTTKVYQGDYLDAINFTVGGIGSGAIQFNGKAQPKIWQIACNHVERELDDTFMAIRVQERNKPAIVRALQTESAGQFEAMSGLTFEGEYPFAKYKFEDNSLPVDVSLEVFNPFIPMDLKNSSIPCAIYQVTVTNHSSDTVTADILSAQKNALGYAEGDRGATVAFGENYNEILTASDGSTLLHMTRKGNKSADMVLMTQANGTTGIAEWRDPASFKNAFSEHGKLSGLAKSSVSQKDTSINGALSAPLTLAPGETQTVQFVLMWSFSETDHGQHLHYIKGRPWVGSGQMYNNWWTDALDLSRYLRSNLADLTARTRRFHDTLYASTLPVWLLDRCSSQLAVLRSQTCWWSSDGYFGAWEGCNPENGCCQANCTHVWHYAQAHARLLPELGRLMRQQDYDMQLEDGLLPYRHNRPKAAADGHFGTILNTYREYLCSVDNSWLKSQWPKVKLSMDWALNEWDPKREGFMQNSQHNTLDGDLDGCSSWLGSLYLSGLEAVARMADIVGEAELANEYRRIRSSGKKMQNERLWNGEYYIQEAGKQRIQDYLDGCHIDQILGEWWADQVNIDRNYPKDRAQKAMQSLLKYNFRADFYGQSLKPRQYCEIDDGGMKMITWPNNPQPIPGMKYGDEVMTGFEYGAGVSMIQNGMVKEGLMVLKVVADRYDGRLRTEGVSDVINGPWGYSGNPFGDDECGKYYGRSLSVWSSLTTLQGFVYDGPAGKIGFNPLINRNNHVSFFTAAQGYGLYKQAITGNSMNASLAVEEGVVKLNEITLTPTKAPKSLVVGYNKEQLEADFVQIGNTIKITLRQTLLIKSGTQLTIKLS